MLQMDINGDNMIFIWISYKIYNIDYMDLYGFILIYMDYVDSRPNMIFICYNMLWI
jgi:hypothetical protein